MGRGVLEMATNRFYKLDLNTMMWTKLFAYSGPSARSEAILTSSNNQLFVLGGKDKGMMDISGSDYKYNIVNC